MTLKEKFSKILPWYSEKDNSNKSNECVKIADDYAIEFAVWFIEHKEFNKSKTPKQLLEIFKKEKGL
jgi:hypothetical protein